MDSRFRGNDGAEPGMVQRHWTGMARPAQWRRPAGMAAAGGNGGGRRGRWEWRGHRKRRGRREWRGHRKRRGRRQWRGHRERRGRRQWRGHRKRRHPPAMSASPETASPAGNVGVNRKRRHPPAMSESTAMPSTQMAASTAGNCQPEWRRQPQCRQPEWAGRRHPQPPPTPQPPTGPAPSPHPQSPPLPYNSNPASPPPAARRTASNSAGNPRCP